MKQKSLSDIVNSLRCSQNHQSALAPKGQTAPFPTIACFYINYQDVFTRNELILFTFPSKRNIKEPPLNLLAIIVNTVRSLRDFASPPKRFCCHAVIYIQGMILIEIVDSSTITLENFRNAWRSLNELLLSRQPILNLNT